MKKNCHVTLLHIISSIMKANRWLPSEAPQVNDPLYASVCISKTPELDTTKKDNKTNSAVKEWQPMHERLRGTCRRHARGQAQLKRVDMCLSGRGAIRLAWLTLPHMLSISLSGTQSHWSTAKTHSPETTQSHSWKQGGRVKLQPFAWLSEWEWNRGGRPTACREVRPPPVPSHSMHSNKTVSQIEGWIDKFMSE